MTAGGKWMHVNDASLVRLAAQGDIDRFADLVDAHYASVYAVALAVTGDCDAAEDLTQSSFVQAHARIGELRDAERFVPWLHAIVRNKSRDWVRRRSRAPALVGDPSEPRGDCISELPVDPHDGAEQSARGEAVRRAVCALPRKYRETVLLRFIADLDHAATARALGIGQSAAKMRWHRARKILQNRLADWAPGALSKVEDELQTR